MSQRKVTKGVMNCRRAANLVSLSMDRPITRRERWQVRLHLLRCRPCRAARSDMLRLRRYLRDLATTRLPTSFVDSELGTAAQARVKRLLRLS